MSSNRIDLRPSRDDVYMQMVAILAKRSTCKRRQVGCILVNHRGHILSTGYNGVPSGYPHCIDTPCEGFGQPSGEGLDKCQAIHAEQNALLQCPDVYDITTCYTLVKPCLHCMKLLLNTSCDRIVYQLDYPHPLALWEASGRKLIHHGLEA